MTEDKNHEIKSRTLPNYNLVILVVSAIVISVLLVVAAMAAYQASGAAQVDLSRPGYSHVREQAINNDIDRPFESSGEITMGVLEDFEKRFAEKSERIMDARIFDASAMSDKTLQIPE